MMEGGDATIDGAKAHIARVYDALLGANDNYQPDRALAFRLRTEWPIVEKIALENRYFLIRAVRHLAQAGLDQFIDIGSGLPTVESVHEVAQATNPDARVAYVDNDPLVLAHARALLATDDNTRIIGGDMRQPEQLLEAVATQHRRIDLDRPVVFLFVSVLHFLDDPHPLLRACQRAMAPGSHMVISHGLADPRIADAAREYREVMGVGTPRSRAEIAALFDGLELLEPGLVPVPLWQPELAREYDPADLPMLGGVGRLPDHSPP